MPRREKERNVSEPPKFQSFKPMGIPHYLLDKIELSVDEYEALRLTDYKKMDHAEAADNMNISRPTFTRLIEKARYKIAKAIVEGKEIDITGGTFSFEHHLYKCSKCRSTFRMCYDADLDNKKCPFCEGKDLIDLNHLYGKDFGKCRNINCTVKDFLEKEKNYNL